MRRMFALCFCFVLVSATLHADSKDPAYYPARIHIFTRHQVTFYHHTWVDETKGEGRANVFENGTVYAVDFSFDCEQDIPHSFGYVAYPAKWKKPGKELTVLIPVFGKTGESFTCTFNTDKKDFAYTIHKTTISTEPIETYKAWMVKHNYDPEHGLDTPTADPKPDDPAH